jgi:hypothetical protein
MKRSIIYMTVALTASFESLPKLAWASQIPSAETNAAPAASSLHGTIYVAWMGKNTPQANVWYTTSNVSGWNPQQEISFAKTTQAPALTTVGNTVYLAWRGQSTNTTDEIYYSTNTGTEWSNQTTVCSGGTCAETTSAPALAAAGSTVFVAWTTSSNTFLCAYNVDGAWAFFNTAAQPPSSFATNAKRAPALAVYGETLYLSWVAAGSSQVSYATFPLSSDIPLSGGAWSLAASISAAAAIAPPALASYALTGVPGAGFYAAWTTSSGSSDHADWDDGVWNAPVPIPGLPIPPRAADARARLE